MTVDREWLWTPRALAALLACASASASLGYGMSRETMCRIASPSKLVTSWAETPGLRKGQIDVDLRAGLTSGERRGAPDFDGYRLGVLDYRWRYVDPRVEDADWPPIHWRVEPHPGGFVMIVQRARWSEYIGEGEDFYAADAEPGPEERYVFIRSGGCWRLAAKDASAMPAALGGTAVHWPTAPGPPVLGVDTPTDEASMRVALATWRAARDASFQPAAKRSPEFEACIKEAGPSPSAQTACESDEQRTLQTALEARVHALADDRRPGEGIERDQRQWQRATDAGCAWYPSFDDAGARRQAAACLSDRMRRRLDALDGETAQGTGRP